MKSYIKNKKEYMPPKVELIKLDNEISLILESDPPLGPDETLNMKSDYMKIDPFKLIV